MNCTFSTKHIIFKQYDERTNFFVDALVLGAFLAYVASVILMMAFCSPYWIESYDESFSSFKNMGLWEYCFKDFSYPYYQFPKLFNGCHNIFSHVSVVLYEMFNIQISTWAVTSLLFSGILCNPRMACTRLANGRSRFRYNRIHFDLLLVGCNGAWIDPLAFENGFAIWVVAVPNSLHMLCHLK